MSNRNQYNPYEPRQHALPQDNTVLTCSMCGGQEVQHLATQDGWVAVATEHGARWICGKQVCKDEARNQGLGYGP